MTSLQSTFLLRFKIYVLIKHIENLKTKPTLLKHSSMYFPRWV